MFESDRKDRLPFLSHDYASHGVELIQSPLTGIEDFAIHSLRERSFQSRLILGLRQEAAHVDQLNLKVKFPGKSEIQLPASPV